MNLGYVIDFSLVALAFLSITAFFYWRQPKAPSLRNSLFGLMLLFGVLFAALDVVVVVVEPLAFLLPAVLVRLLHSLFLMVVQLSGAIFFLYCLVLTGFIRSRARRVVLPALLPFALTALLLMLPLGSSGIFYLDAQHIYHRGALYILLYVDTAIYLLASLSVVFVRRQRLMGKKLLCICSFLAVLFLSMLIQYNQPQLLLNAMANALALALIYHVLEAPSIHVDVSTGVLSYTAFPLVLQDASEQNQRCTLLFFPLYAVAPLNNSLGVGVADQLLSQFAAWLRSGFGDGHLFRLSGDVFAVLRSGGSYCGQQELEKIAATLPESLRVGRQQLQPRVGLACINSEDAGGAASMLALSDYILQLKREERLPALLLADADFKEQLRATQALERQLELSIAKGDIEVFYQPLHDCRGRLSALEALVRISDGQGGYLPTQQAVELSEQNGSIRSLSEQILRRVCLFIRDNNAAAWGLHHIGVNLSALQFIDDDLCYDVTAIMDEYGVDHSLVSFEITETAAASVSDVSRNMRTMINSGYSFLLDDFGQGYANFSNIAQLPLLCVKIDKSLLWEAEQSPQRLAFLRGVVAMLQQLRLTSVCEGVETQAQLELLQEMGVDMLQGYFFSPPLPPQKLLSYIAGRAEHGL